MFYSNEILGSRQYGVATIWWVATIGRRGATKVVSRKAIQEVQINKACEKIIDPGAPLALRLQSNLLYGVSRIYSEQCRYVLDDAARVKATMRTFYRQMSDTNNETDPKAGNAGTGQNIIPDDPHFTIDNFVMPEPKFSGLEDLDGFLRKRAGGSQASSKLSQLSPGVRSIASESSGRPSMIGFDFLGSAHSSQRFATPVSFGRNVHKPVDERLAFLPGDECLAPVDHDLGFIVDAEGNMIELGEPELPPLLGDEPITPVAPQQGQFSASRRDNLVVLPSEGLVILGEEPLPDAEALETQNRVGNTQENSNGSQAPRPARRRRQRKAGIFLDNSATFFPKAVIRDWGANYVEISKAASLQGLLAVKPARARSNAIHFIFGTGIWDIGQDTGLPGIKHPLAELFTGDTLRDNVFGVPDIEMARSSTPGTSRRRTAAEAFEEEEGRRVRQRSEEGEIVLPDIDVALEVGRDGIQAVDPHSSMMPWSRQGSNVPGSAVKDQQKSRSASVTSLLPKGSVVPDIERFSDPHFPSDNFAGAEGPHSSSVSQVGFDDSQWKRANVEQAAEDFLAYAVDHAKRIGYVEDKTAWVSFEDLVVPERDRKGAAAQGFYHVLSLAMMGRIKVWQQDGQEQFGRIDVGVNVEDDFNEGGF